MLQYERIKRQANSTIRDIVLHPADASMEATEVLHLAGFSLCEDSSFGDADDDDDAIPRPPSWTQVHEGGNRMLQLGGRALYLDLWSIDEETQCKVGFSGAHDISRGVLYMKINFDGSCDNCDFQGVERPTKSAITSLLDIADSCHARKLTIGLGVEHAGSVNFVCSLLYLGFQVVPSRKSPLIGCALLLDLDIGMPSDGFTSTDHGTCTGTSDCSTAAEDNAAARPGVVPPESDWSSGE